MPELKVDLSTSEVAREAELLPIIKDGVKWIKTRGVEFWDAAREYRESRLYRARGFDNWEEFCEKELGSSKRRIDQFIKGASVIKQIETTNGKVGNNVPIPERESQTRELAKVPPEQQPEVWQEAVKEADGEQPTAAQVKAAVERKTKPPEPEIVRDPLGVPMPAYLLPVFTGLELFKEADSLCRKLQDVIEKLSTNPAGAVFRRELETAGKSEAAIKHRHKSLQQIKSDLKLSRPYTRCPYCASRENGKAFKDCKQCRGMGWATKMTFDSAPADYRAAVEKVK